MKNLYAFLLAVMMSFSANTVSAQAGWVDLYVPESISTIAIDDSMMAIFGLNQYYVSPMSSSIEWTAHALPLSEIVVAAEFVGDELFVLFSGHDLYVFKDSNWSLALSDINGISQNSGHLFVWSSEWINEYNESGWQCQIPFPAATYVAGGSSVIAANDYSMYQGASLEQLSFLKEFEMDIKEILLTADEYIYVGKAVGNMASYHISPIEASYAYDHILTTGVFNSVAQFNNNIYVAGRIGVKGVIFDAHDMSQIDWFPEEIVHMRASRKAMLALGIEALHMKLDANTSIDNYFEDTELSGCNLQVAPNPIEAGKLRVIATEKTQVQVLTMDGRQVSQMFFVEGVNLVNVQDWKSGMYIISSLKGAVKFLIK